MCKLIAFLKNNFTTAFEYCLIATGISVAIIGLVNGLGTPLNNTFTSISALLH